MTSLRVRMAALLVALLAVAMAGCKSSADVQALETLQRAVAEQLPGTTITLENDRLLIRRGGAQGKVDANLDKVLLEDCRNASCTLASAAVVYALTSPPPPAPAR